jgi:hypothetical protein
MTKRLSPTSRTARMDEKISDFERIMRPHFREMNYAKSSRVKSYLDAVIYGGVIFILLVVVLGVFGDLS